DCPAIKHLWLDGEDIRNTTFEAYIPTEPGVEAQGWANCYEFLPGSGAIRTANPDEWSPRLIVHHRAGLIRWE
ncbi:MAG: hypothetical protein IH587_08130, partial [Anaerolineae bacterium]|nr:hypothetical protein [Anaerolineae bacterium]